MKVSELQLNYSKKLTKIFQKHLKSAA